MRKFVLFAVQCRPNQAESLDRWKDRDPELWRNRHLGMSWDRSAPPIRSIAKTMIGTDNDIVFDPSEAQPRATVNTEIARDDCFSGGAIDDQIDVKELNPNRSVAEFIRPSDGIPAFCQNGPILQVIG
jgi:hypothetical protein